MSINRYAQIIGLAIIVTILLLVSAFVTAQEADDSDLITPPIGTPWTSDFRASNIERFTFSSVEDSITTVIVENEALAQGITATLVAMDDRETISSMNLNVGAVAFCVPAGDKDYILTIENPTTNDADSYEALITYQPTVICGESLIATVMNDSQAAQSASDDDASSEASSDNNENDDENTADNSCTAITQSNASPVNVRTLPSTVSPVLAVENVGNEVELIGQALDGSWLLVGLSDGRTGYISASILSVVDGCAIVNLPNADYDEATLQALELSANISDPVNSGIDMTATEDNMRVDVASSNISDDGMTVVMNNDEMEVSMGGDDGVVVNISDDGMEVDMP